MTRIWLLALAVLVPLSGAFAQTDDRQVRALVNLGVNAEVARQVVRRWNARKPERPEALVVLIERSAQAGAPVDLVVDKAAEGLAKGVPERSLVAAIETWGAHYAEAAHTAARLRKELQSEGVGEREAVLQLSVLQRLERDGAWLSRLGAEAKASKTDLRAFLGVAGAVGHLTSKLGLDRSEAEDLGRAMMRHQVAREDIAKYVQAIEVSRERSTIAEAAQSIREKILRGVSPEDALRAARNAGAPPATGQDRGKGKGEDKGSSDE
jgi:hypothetical protein